MGVVKVRFLKKKILILNSGSRRKNIQENLSNLILTNDIRTL